MDTIVTGRTMDPRRNLKKLCFPDLFLLEGTAFMYGNMIRLVAFDFILGIVLSAPVGVALVVEIPDVDLNDLSFNMTGFRVPTNMVTYGEFMGHYRLSLNLWRISM